MLTKKKNQEMKTNTQQNYLIEDLILFINDSKYNLFTVTAESAYYKTKKSNSKTIINDNRVYITFI